MIASSYWQSLQKLGRGPIEMNKAPKELGVSLH